MEELLATSVLILLHDIYEALNIVYLIVVLKTTVKLCYLLLHLNFPHIPHILHLKGFVNTAHYNIFDVYSYYQTNPIIFDKIDPINQKLEKLYSIVTLI